MRYNAEISYEDDVEVGGEKFQKLKFIKEEISYNLTDYSKYKHDASFLVKLTRIYHRIKNKVRDIYYEIYYGFERMFKGYDSTEIFNLCDEFQRRYYKIFKRFKETCDSYVDIMTEEEWFDILNKMITHLYYMDKDNVYEALDHKAKNGWESSYEAVEEVVDRHKDEFFKMFSKYFYFFWN